MKNIILLFFFSALFSCNQKTTADKIIINANVYTVDTSKPMAQAFAIKDGKFLEIGTNEEIQILKSEKT